MAEEKESICADCGLCCDGTISQFASFGENEDPASWDKLTVSEKSEKKVFEFPCQYLDGCKCSIYNESKPKVCTTYMCRVARGVKKGLLKEERAKMIIERTKELREDFEKEFNEHYIFNSEHSVRKNIATLTEVVGGDKEFITFVNDHEDFKFSLVSLRKVIANNFRLKKKGNNAKQGGGQGGDQETAE